ncbi:decarboxylase [Candidatus Woesearchaeota archaeon CG10_big_fil_rev_8_21_14_0_10_45_5]|nr:MAG: decarboxylase [Candidatus Woesearchaeota archaeon CG10_big_fil_rev_8_21_14_0_10_45_5]PIU30222.1 MAG: decarboxylase [Candidatus Woesearchaeota archaeon CG07_land_8_20_14_0_80_44_23]
MARFILSRKKALSQYKLVSSIADAISYSFKTNPEVGKILERETDCYISMSSFSYLPFVKDKKRILFFPQAWNSTEIKKLFALGIDKFVTDNQRDLDELVSFLGKSGKKAWILLRMRMNENTIYTGKHFVFGMTADEINRNIKTLAGNASIEKLGIHFHRKTQNTSEWSIREELEDSLTEETLKSISIINIGGGLPSAYNNSKPEMKSILRKLRQLKNWLNGKGINVIIEPGRFIAAPAVELEARIKSVSENNIIIDCSVYNCAMDTFVMNIRLIVKGETDERKGKSYVIKGCTPDSIDIFRYNVYLKNPKAGDKIVFVNAGAYNFASDFDGLKKIPTVIVD